MGVTTSQQILRYYELYRDTEIIFSKEVLTVLRVDPRQIYLKCNGVQWACIINSASLMSARIIVGTKGGAYAAIQKDNTSVTLRFFFVDNHGKGMSFFVNTRVTNIEAHMASNELAIATLTFNSKPPDDLIEILGRLLEAKTNSMSRTEERIPITADSKRRLSLVKEEALVFVQNVPRNCIIRNLSFSGANILMMGIPKFLHEKETMLRLEFDEPHEFININGIVTKTENIEGRKDLVALAMKFDETTIPISYKVHINNCLPVVRRRATNVAVIPTQGKKNAKDSENLEAKQAENENDSEKTIEQAQTEASAEGISEAKNAEQEQTSKTETPAEEASEVKNAEQKPDSKAETKTEGSKKKPETDGQTKEQGVKQKPQGNQ